MAKRVFEIAKELSVKSKAIVLKCEAEGIPNITNHMSSVSAGLEATIREWFGENEKHTAVETAAKVDLDKVRVKPKKQAARKTIGQDSEDDSGESESETATAVAEPEERAAGPVAPAPSEPEGEDEREIEEPTPVVEHATPEHDHEPVAEPEAPVIEATPQVDEDEGEDEDTDTGRPDRRHRPAASTDRPKSHGPKPIMNVPKRPKITKPAGPRLEVQTPAKLAGPKVVRIEQPEPVHKPRTRAGGDGPFPPRSRAGRGAGSDAPTTESDDAGTRSPRRNKRRAGGPGGPSGPTGPSEASPDRFQRKPRTGGTGAWRTQDLIEREERLSRSGGFLRQRRRDQKLKDQSHREKASTLAETGGTVRVTTPLTIKDLSAATGVKAADIVKRLFMQGIMATVNSGIEVDKAQEIMMEYEIDLQVGEKATGEALVLEQFEQRDLVDERPRTPVVTILGHVDHGKTSLLDRIRNTHVASGEAGGITQATSAFLVPVASGDTEQQVCFLDTPGHEAFTEMRSRGANVTDIVVLVVAADDGLMPQSIESINHAKAAEVPLIVALNKIDVPGADVVENIQRIYGQLAEQGLNPTEWGGETEVVKTSATTGVGVQTLLETINLTAELLDLRADFAGAATGSVIEAKIEEGRGPVASLLVQQGQLKLGDFIVAGRAFGRVRDITNDRAERIKSATPSTPIQISGIDEVPNAGDRFYVVKTLKQAQEAAEQRRQIERERQLAQPKVTLDSMFAAMESADVHELLIVLKADVQGSVDAIKKSIEDIATDEVKIRVLHSAVGGVAESDVTLAAASNAVILGFNVIPSSQARKLAEAKGVEIRSYQVIYDIVDDVRKAAEGLLEPELRQEVLGHAEVRQVFKISKVGAIAGCYATDGTIERNAYIRITRDDIVIENGRVLEQLKRFKDDAKEVRAGQECGMKIQGYDDIKEGDILECYRNIEVKRTL